MKNKPSSRVAKSKLRLQREQSKFLQAVEQDVKRAKLLQQLAVEQPSKLIMYWSTMPEASQNVASMLLQYWLGSLEQSQQLLCLPPDSFDHWELPAKLGPFAAILLPRFSVCQDRHQMPHQHGLLVWSTANQTLTFILPKRQKFITKTEQHG